MTSAVFASSYFRARLLRRTTNVAIAMQTMARPPITPPTIAPILVLDPEPPLLVPGLFYPHRRYEYVLNLFSLTHI